MPNVYNYNDAFIEILKGVASGTLSNPNNAGKNVGDISNQIMATARLIATSAESLYDLTVAAPAKGQFAGVAPNFTVNNTSVIKTTGEPPDVIVPGAAPAGLA